MSQLRSRRATARVDRFNSTLLCQTMTGPPTPDPIWCLAMNEPGKSRARLRYALLISVAREATEPHEFEGAIESFRGGRAARRAGAVLADPATWLATDLDYAASIDGGD